MKKLFTISLSVASVFYLAQETKTDSIAQAKEIQEVVLKAYQMNDGIFLNKGENQNNIALRYQLKNWEFTTAMYWVGMPSRYGTKSLPGTLVNLEKSSQILNNKNMFVLGVSYDFSLGKKLQLQKKLQN